MSFVKAKEYLSKYNLEDKIMEFDVSSATVSEAAMAINCSEGEIVKTLSFLVGENPILICVAGDAKIDNSKFKHAVGGVCPFGVNSNVSVYLDESLKQYSIMYPACGSSNSAVKLTLEELEKSTNYIKYVDVCKDN